MLQRLVLSLNLLPFIYCLEYNNLLNGIDEFQMLKKNNEKALSAFVSSQNIKPFQDEFIKNKKDIKILSPFKNDNENLFLKDIFRGPIYSIYDESNELKIPVNEAIPNLIFEDHNNLPFTRSTKKVTYSNFSLSNKTTSNDNNLWKHVTPSNLWSLPFNPFSLGNQEHFSTVGTNSVKKLEQNSTNTEENGLNEFQFVTPSNRDVFLQKEMKVTHKSFATFQPFRKQQNFNKNSKLIELKNFSKKESFTTPFKKITIFNNDRCKNFPDGVFLATDSCQRHYIKCVQGKSIVRYCDEIFVFSNKSSTCVPKVLAPECKLRLNRHKNKNLFTFSNNTNSNSFCDKRGDGMFQHPSNCTRIIQCFGKHKFEYPSCPNNLAFDEKTQKCNYADQVEGCLQKEVKFALTRSRNLNSNILTQKEIILNNNNSLRCNGGNYSMHVLHNEDCTKYLRCAEGRFVLMTCPEGAVFNPQFNVCESRSIVGDCKKMIKRFTT